MFNAAFFLLIVRLSILLRLKIVSKDFFSSSTTSLTSLAMSSSVLPT